MAADEQPRVSVIVRTKDRPALLEQALASVADQEGLAVEAVVVNDGGAPVGDVVERFRPRLPVRLVELHPARGRSAAANAGLPAATGRLIAFLDDDDLLRPGALAALVAAAGEGVAYGRVVARRYDPAGAEPPRTFQVFGRPFDEAALLFENFLPIIGCVLPADAVRRAGGLDESLDCYEDWDLFLRLSRTLPFTYVDREVAEYRVFGEAFITGAGGQERQHAGRLAVYAKHWERLTPELMSRIQFHVKGELLPGVRVQEGEAWRDRLSDLERANRDLAEGVAFERERAAALEGRLAESERRCDACRAELAERERRHAELMPGLVSVVIVNFNGRRHLERCLPALLHAPELPLEVIVVDNGSSDDSLAWLAGHHPEVRVIAAGRNLGFGAANRLGAEAASAELLVLLNNDTEVEPGWLWPLLRPLLARPQVAFTCSVLRLMHCPEVLNGSGGGMSKLGYGFDHGFARPFAPPAPGEPATRPVLFPTAAAMAARRWEFLGDLGFDATFFMYHEDVDLGWRACLLGREVLVCRESVVRHAFGGTSHAARGLLWRERLGSRHNVRSILKHYEPLNVARALKGLLKLWWGQRALRHILHVAGWNLAHLPGTLRQRVRVQRRRVVSDRELVERGLVGRCPYPPPTPELPRARPERDADGWIATPTLLPGEYSALGRLGWGWYPPERIGRDMARATSGSARCWLKVAPGARGRVVAEVHLPEAAAAGREVTLTVNGVSSAVVADGSLWQELAVEAAADERGLLQVDLDVPPWLPHDLFGNWDFRSLGCGVRALRFAPDAAPAAAAPTLGVVITTFNRWPVLERTLAALAAQTRPADQVVVVDDGSSDGTFANLERWRDAHSALPLVAVRQDNTGQGGARNHALEHVTTDLVLFLGDDIIPEPDLVAEHLAQHEEVGEPAAVVGFTDWDREGMRVTPFLEMVNVEGQQFGYDFIADREDVPYTCFYTSNISLPRDVLGEAPFHPAFRGYGWEDVELGWRLSVRGLRIVHRRGATAHHHHPSDLASFFRRDRQVGRALASLLRLHPELEGEGRMPPPRPPRWFPLAVRLVPPLVPLLSRLDRAGVRLPRRLLRRVLLTAFFMGRRDAAAVSPG